MEGAQCHLGPVHTGPQGQLVNLMADGGLGFHCLGFHRAVLTPQPCACSPASSSPPASPLGSWRPGLLSLPPCCPLAILENGHLPFHPPPPALEIPTAPHILLMGTDSSLSSNHVITGWPTCHQQVPSCAVWLLLAVLLPSQTACG